MKLLAVIDVYETVPSSSRNGRKRKHGRFKCDECGSLFVRHVNLKKQLERNTHFCGPECVEAASQEDHIIDRKRRETNVSRFGYENAFEVPAIQISNARRAQSTSATQKRVMTNIERYGVPSVWCRADVQSLNGIRANTPTANAKRVTTNVTRYGVAVIFQRSDVRAAAAMAARNPAKAAKCAQTMLERYGVTCGFKLPGVQSAARNTSNTPAAKEKRRVTNTIRHGVPYLFMRQDVQDAAHAMCNTDTARQQRYQTMLKNGTHRRSSYERRLEALLVERYGHDTVVAQDRTLAGGRHPIDFYVKSIDTYIEVDGEYWHGLDRPIEEIAQLKHKGDAKVLSKWQWDRALDARCKHEHKRLVRITDKELDDDRWDFTSWIKDVERKSA